MSWGSGTSRLEALDGLRGWAALSVVTSHCLLETFKVRFPELKNFGTVLVANGTFAVAIFLAISGYVLTIRRWHNPANPPLLVAIFRRYVRLTIPIIAATFLVWLLMTLGQTPTRAAYLITRTSAWYSTFVRFEPDIFRAAFFALAGAYGYLETHNYHPFLWTMMIELWGSVVIFAISQSDRYLREAYTPLLLCVAVSFAYVPLALPFFCGALIALAERDGITLKRSPAVGLAAALLLAGALITAAATTLVDKDPRTLSVLGVFVFLAVRHSGQAQRFLTLPVSQFLGQISFPLYLVQFAVIVSFSAQLIIWADAAGVLNATTALGIAAASVAVSLVAATLFLPIERGTLALLRRFDRARGSPRASVAVPAT